MSSVALDAGNPDADGLVGSVTIWPSDVLPSTKYLFAEGQAISRADYSLLFSRYGEIHGVGDGSTTFNLPDYPDMFLRGGDGTNTGDAGGSASDTASGSVSGGTVSAAGFSIDGQGSFAVQSGASGNVQSGTNLTLGGSGSLTGATFSGTVDTIPPYKVVRFIIKVL